MKQYPSFLSPIPLTFGQHGSLDLVLCFSPVLTIFVSQSIMEYNGGSVIAMVGKDCVAIASDLRLGNQALGISSNFQKVRIQEVNISAYHSCMFCRSSN